MIVWQVVRYSPLDGSINENYLGHQTSKDFFRRWRNTKKDGFSQIVLDAPALKIVARETPSVMLICVRRIQK